ncbi:MAG TPA: LuxR C-terminal-related transcriptional regulator [Anaerolineae bacterium]|nr:LuxR C-terminal-related transcriptional regulator [Anaerolineae bacterium]
MTIETSALTLIRTKMQRPSLPGDLILRRRLLDRLCAGSSRKLTLISAQAGAGKTTLMTQWLADANCPQHSAWLSLDEHDNELVVFVSYLIGAIRVVFPGACENTLGLLAAAQTPPLRVIATSLVNELDDLAMALWSDGDRSEAPSKEGTRSVSGLILALDDYQAITEPAIHELMSDLIQHLPRGMHLALATRSDPPLPLPQLRARRKMNELRFVDLRFTPEEADALLQGALGREVSAESTALLVEKAEGWVVGLRLAALTLRTLGHDEDFQQRVKGTSSALIVEYLANEVLAQQSPEIQDFVLRTSVLDRFCAPLCEAVCWGGAPAPGSSGGTAVQATEIPAGRSQEIIDWIAGANLFVVPLDEEGRWYRYHHLFRDFLRRRLEQQYGTTAVSELHARAGAWLDENGSIEEAFEHVLAANDLDRAVQLLEAHRHDMMNREQWPRLRRWLGRLPQQLIEQRVPLLMTKAWDLAIFYRFDEVIPVLEQVKATLEQNISSFDEEQRLVLAGEVAALWGVAWYWLGQGQICLDHTSHALEVTPPEHAWVVGISKNYQIVAYQSLGRLEMAYQEIHRAQAALGRYDDVFAAQIWLSQLIIEILSASLPRAEEASTQLVDLAQRHKLHDDTAAGFQTLGYIHYQWNDLEAAERCFSKVLDLRYQSLPGPQAHSSFGLAQTYRALGRHDEAARLAEEAIEWARGTGNPAMLLEAYSFASRLALLEGQSPDTDYWAASLSNTFPVMLLIEIPHLTLATILIARGTPDALQEAAELLARLRQFVEETHNTWRLIEVLSLQALLHSAQGDESAAFTALEQAITLAEPGGFIRLFVDLGPSMARLLDQLRQQGVAPDYIARILAAFETKDDILTGPGGRMRKLQDASLVDPLTPRELEVLALLAKLRTNKQIAEELVISPVTVKTHTLRIYRKLDVGGRQHAVAKARELGLLPSNVM